MEKIKMLQSILSLFKRKREFTFNVAGVTYKTGRCLRQTMLHKIKHRIKPFNGILSYKLEGYDYKGEQAIGVYVNEWMIGSVPHDLVDFLIKNQNKTVKIKSIKIVGGGTNYRTGEQYSYGAEVTIVMKE